jgi:hypothetical protein
MRSCFGAAYTRHGMSFDESPVIHFMRTFFSHSITLFSHNHIFITEHNAILLTDFMTHNHKILNSMTNHSTWRVNLTILLTRERSHFFLIFCFCGVEIFSYALQTANERNRSSCV